MSDKMEQRMGLEREIPQLSLAYVADQSSSESRRKRAHRPVFLQ